MPLTLPRLKSYNTNRKLCIKAKSAIFKTTKNKPPEPEFRISPARCRHPDPTRDLTRVGVQSYSRS